MMPLPQFTVINNPLADIIPTFIMDFTRFSTIENASSLSKAKWTRKLTMQLGDKNKMTANGFPAWSLKRVIDAISNPTFQKLVLFELKTQQFELDPNGFMYMSPNVVETELCHITKMCQLLTFLNKQIKYYPTDLISISKTKAYRMKSWFIKYLYTNGFCDSLVFEASTNLFRFTFNIGGVEYTWHQLKKDVVGYVKGFSVLMGNSDFKEDTNMDIGSLAVLDNFTYFESGIYTLVIQALEDKLCCQ